MIRAMTVSAAAAAALLAAGTAFAQGSTAPTPPAGIPGSNNPYARPLGGDNDISSMPPDRDRLANGAQQASDAQAAARARSKYGPAVAAKPADIVAQATVSDTADQPIGTIESVDGDGAVIATAGGKVKVPLNAFGKNRKGLLIGMSKKDFDALVAKANASPAG